MFGLWMFGFLDVLGSKNTKSFNKSFCEFNISSFSSHLVKYVFLFYFVNFYFFQYQKQSSSFFVEDLFLFKSMQIFCSHYDKTMVPNNFKKNLHHINKKK